MKYCTILFICLLFSCTSKPVNTGKKTNYSKLVQVEYIDDRKKAFNEGSSKESAARRKFNSDAMTKNRVWVKMFKNEAELTQLLKKSAKELGAMLDGASASKTTLLVAALSEKSFLGIEPLAKVLTDTRGAVFSNDSALYWYEEKGKPAEVLELRVYAALQIEKLSTIQAYGVRFFFHKIHTNTGLEEVLYATQGAFAISKEDVCKNWLKWWEKNKAEYK